MTPDVRRELHQHRVAAIRRLIDQRGAPGAILTTRRNFAWATVGGENHVVLSGDQGVAGLLVTPSTATVLTAVNEAARIGEEELEGLPLVVEAVPWHEGEAMDHAARGIAAGVPLTDADLEDDLLELRCILADAEAERLAWLAGRAVAAVTAAIQSVAPGVSEHEVAAVAAGRLAVEGIRSPVLLAAADDRIDRYRHPLPTARRVERRLMLVVVAEQWGLHAAVTRFAELEDPEPDLGRRLAAVADIHAAMIAATTPGRTLGQVLEATCAAYAHAGYPDEWRLHHQGGIIGYQGRERIAVPGDRTVIREGMAFAWNPSITGAKAEETILLAAGGTRILTAR